MFNTHFVCIYSITFENDCFKVPLLCTFFLSVPFFLGCFMGASLSPPAATNTQPDEIDIKKMVKSLHSKQRYTLI